MAPNTQPIETQTKLKRIDLTQTGADNQIVQQCDILGRAGYELKAAFEKDGNLVLIFQLTR
jgi:hypothetical protein